MTVSVKYDIPRSRRATHRHGVRNAVFSIDPYTADVTDLLKMDFEVLDIVERAVSLLASCTLSDEGERLEYAELVLSVVLEIQVDRVIALTERLAETGEVGVVEKGKCAVYPQCDTLNRLGQLAQQSDYANLKLAGYDAFSRMSYRDLASVLNPTEFLEMQVRLRAQNLLTPHNEVCCARWMARGLDAYHAVEKVKYNGTRKRRAYG